jgi:RNA polymerase sigma factor (sigma-70 family)
MEPGARVFVLDDDLISLRAIDRVLRSNGFIVQTFTSPRLFLAQPPYDGPACLVLDLRMPGLSGLEVQEALARRAVLMPIVFFSGASDVPVAALAMRRGALDFLVKPVNDIELLDAVSRALSAASEHARQRREKDEIQTRFATLTRRERQVCELVAQGLPNKQIGFELGTSENTVKVHRGRVMSKLRVDSVAALVWLLARRMPEPR